MDELIKALRAHALENYETGGWDMIYECYEDSEIREVLVNEQLTTPESAIAYFGKNIAGVYNDRRKDVQSEIF